MQCRALQVLLLGGRRGVSMLGSFQPPTDNRISERCRQGSGKPIPLSLKCESSPPAIGIAKPAPYTCTQKSSSLYIQLDTWASSKTAAALASVREQRVVYSQFESPRSSIHEKPPSLPQFRALRLGLHWFNRRYDVIQVSPHCHDHSALV